MNAHDTPAVTGAALPRMGAYSRQSRSYINTFRRGRHDQRGAILVIALIMLLLLTIIGVAGLRGTTMEERMAGNMKEQYRSFQVAEYALRLGEQDIDGNITTLQSVNCEDSVVDDPSTLTYTDIDANALNPDEVTPDYHLRYCEAGLREVRDAQGFTATGDAGSRAKVMFMLHEVMGVGRVPPDSAVTALASTYAEPD